MKNILSLLSIIFLSFSSYCQNAGLNDVTNIVNSTSPNSALYGQFEILKGEVRIRGLANRYSDINGSPYYLDTKVFLPGKLILLNDKLLDVNIRYDIAAEEMQVKLEDNKFQALKDNIPVMIKDVVFKKFNYLNSEGKYYVGYFKPITKNPDADLLLLEKLIKEVNGTERNRARGFPPKFIDDSEFYLKFKTSGEAIPSERRTKDFVKAFPFNNQGKIENYIKKNNLKPKNEEDLVKIIDYYNNEF